MHNSFLEILYALQNEGKAFATAMVVRRKVPSSGKPGDKAIITEDGTIHGWIGGGCTRGIVLKEALLAIKESKPRFVRISPEDNMDDMPNTKLYKMTCQSGGSVDLYIEPVLPKPQIVIFGRSHIGLALARISKAMDYKVTVVNESLEADEYHEVKDKIDLADFSGKMLGENSFIVVCTQGVGDEDALEAAIKSGSKQIAFVASRRKANAIFHELRGRGITFDQLATIKTPAGLDINAKLPEEVAISILAQTIKEIRTPLATEQSSPSGKGGLDIKNDEYYMNPVCNIPIHKATAKHVVKHNDEDVYFCCDGCKVKFEAEPEKYLSAV
ncbi:MAG: XdhC family protein [Bacteroidota bacterium]